MGERTIVKQVAQQKQPAKHVGLQGQLAKKNTLLLTGGPWVPGTPLLPWNP